MKKVLMFLFLLQVGIVSASSNLNLAKEQYKLQFAELRNPFSGAPTIAIGDRIEADALLELATEGYNAYVLSYKDEHKWNLVHSDEIVLIMPRIDLLEKHLNDLAKTTEDLYVFIMENDKLDNEYGDRSWKTYEKSVISKKLPKNVQVFKLKNESVTEKEGKNNFEDTNIIKSAVYQNQILKIYNQISRFKKI